ncbi:phage head-tail joining protein [Stakelama tenebrarum]|uniref:Uncharacterized protein n=1 Tax=Stakelama tenebrarum TaxID=2711215 RepID=A0A6G6Y4X5_9SPHN|nr:hypothetical protein [Sphingosinithalassobacter tenebrarum]QIG79982.1 hypothetical protein G5C33_09475 [Sphingosinithalassobacter tenebrarum]
MTTTADQIAGLEAALASGELTVESDGERVTYQSVPAMMQALDYLKRKEATEAAPAGGVRPRTTVAVFDPN